MYLFLLTISIVLDLINIILGILIIYLILRFLIKDFDILYVVFLLGILLITLAPIAGLFGIFSERSANAVFFFKLSGIAANVSAILLSMMSQIVNDGKLNVYLNAIMIYVLYLSIIDIIKAPMFIINVGNLKDYTIYYSKIGAILITFILIYTIFMFARLSLNMRKRDPLNKAIITYSKFMISSLMMLISSYLIDVLIYPFSIARYTGLIGIAIFLYGIYYILYQDSYFFIRYFVDLKGILLTTEFCNIKLLSESIDLYEIEDDITRGVAILKKMKCTESICITLRIGLRTTIVCKQSNISLVIVFGRYNRFLKKKVKSFLKNIEEIVNGKVKEINYKELQRAIMEAIYDNLGGLLPTIRRWEL